MSERPYVSFAEVKQKVSIPDVLQVLGIADQFRRQGQTWSGVCCLPEHVHGPSPNPNQFRVAVRDGVSVFHCFGDCARGGDVVEFVRSMTGLSHAHLRFWFVQHFGHVLSTQKPRGDRNGSGGSGGRDAPTKEAREVGQEPQRANVVLPTETLTADERPIKPLRFRLRLDPTCSYLRERGLSEELIERYGLGLCQRGLLAGYVAVPVYGYPPDEFPLAYLGRWPGEDYDESAGRPRYRWPDGFEKTRVLFGLHEALDSTDGRPLIVVEGVFDALKCIQQGAPATVAAFGSSLSDDQVRLLIATGRPIVLMFDGEAAGRAGMEKAAARLIRHTFVRMVCLEEGRQPDDLSADEVRQIVDSVSVS